MSSAMAVSPAQAVKMKPSTYSYGTMEIHGETVFYAKGKGKYGWLYTVSHGSSILYGFSSVDDALAGIPSKSNYNAFYYGCTQLGDLVNYMEHL